MNYIVLIVSILCIIGMIFALIIIGKHNNSIIQEAKEIHKIIGDIERIIQNIEQQNDDKENI